jgi:hypothetical protein
MYYAKIIKAQIKEHINSCFVDDNISEDEKLILINNGWKEVIEEEDDVDSENEYFEKIKEIIFNGVDFYLTTNLLFRRDKCISDIDKLKQQLSDSDYKVIKNMEAQLVNEELPYDSVTLHVERQALRDKINELEELLKNN